MEDINKDFPIMIVGLGNPGPAYRHTRHNFGFLAIDELANACGIQVKRLKFKAMIGEGRYAESKLILVKPMTFMNESGKAVSPLLRFYKLPTSNLLVIHDDLDLPLGTLRLRPSGGTSGQRGMASIITQLGTQDFPRMRLESAVPLVRWTRWTTSSKTFCLPKLSSKKLSCGPRLKQAKCLSLKVLPGP